ncbi:MAG: hypothetical protein IJA91_06925 [Clostridia bacterium]|nr:hypothetical protein [Clostridia bacterium]
MMGKSGNSGIQYRSVGAGRKVLLEQIKLVITLSLTGCILIALETTCLSRIPIPLFGWSCASPALGLLFSMAVGFLYGEREGGVTGLLCGWLSDATSTGTAAFGMMLLPLLYFLCGYMSGTVGKRRLAHNLPSFIIFSVVGSGLKFFLSVGQAVLDLQSLPPMEWIWRGPTPAWVMTVLFSTALYGIVWGERKLLEPK